jgi:hypothetical protein
MVELLKEIFPMVEMRENYQKKVELCGKSLEKCRPVEMIKKQFFPW